MRAISEKQRLILAFLADGADGADGATLGKLDEYLCAELDLGWMRLDYTRDPVIRLERRGYVRYRGQAASLREGTVKITDAGREALRYANQRAAEAYVIRT